MDLFFDHDEHVNTHESWYDHGDVEQISSGQNYSEIADIFSDNFVL